MKRQHLFIVTLTFLLMSISTTSAISISSEASVKQQMINESIRKYKGNCPCPYSKMKNGRTCGKSSAYSKPGGKSPLCYATDITSTMVKNYKK
jgi:hypothetical protein